MINPSLDRKLRDVAGRHEIDPDRFVRVGSQLRRVWPFCIKEAEDGQGEVGRVGRPIVGCGRGLEDWSARAPAWKAGDVPKGYI